MIGALALADLAAALEAAADAGDGETVLAKHAAMMDRYDALIREIGAVTGAQDLPAEEETLLEFSPEEDGILEFLPDSD